MLKTQQGKRQRHEDLYWNFDSGKNSNLKQSLRKSLTHLFFPV